MRHLLSAILALAVFNLISTNCGELYDSFEDAKPEVEIFVPGVREYVGETREYVGETEVKSNNEESLEEEMEYSTDGQRWEEIHLDEEERELLAHLIFAEAGSDWCEDNMLYYVGSVVLNRIESEYFPDTMREVIYQPGQYSCVNNGMIEYEYNQRAYNVAEDLLTSGSCLPSNVLFQAQFEQGDGTYVIVQNMYFCYKGEFE